MVSEQMTFMPYILAAVFAGMVVTFAVVVLSQERRRRESRRDRELREHINRYY
jgi:hypothetical protein